jgi:hypothetical protein
MTLDPPFLLCVEKWLFGDDLAVYGQAPTRVCSRMGSADKAQPARRTQYPSTRLRDARSTGAQR